jgi:hypothetical protein
MRSYDNDTRGESLSWGEREKREKVFQIRMSYELNPPRSQLSERSARSLQHMYLGLHRMPSTFTATDFYVISIFEALSCRRKPNCGAERLKEKSISEVCYKLITRVGVLRFGNCLFIKGRIKLAEQERERERVSYRLSGGCLVVRWMPSASLLIHGGFYKLSDCLIFYQYLEVGE